MSAYNQVDLNSNNSKEDFKEEKKMEGKEREKERDMFLCMSAVLRIQLWELA